MLRVHFLVQRGSGLMLQFVSYRMVSSYFPFHVVLIFSLAYVPMIGFIA